MKLAFHQPQYLPWTGYFHKIDLVDGFVFQDDVQYKHHEFQNANFIRTANGKLRLSVPVLTHGKFGQLIYEVMIDNKQKKWRKKHWASIEHSYRKAPFFNESKDFFSDVYSRHWERLVDINLHIIKFILKELNITTSIFMESEIYTGTKTAEDRIIAVCKQMGADTYFSGAGGKCWMDHTKFEEAGINLEFQEFHHPVYPQLYGDFLQYMSVIDLMFNVGANSIDFIRGV